MAAGKAEGVEKQTAMADGVMTETALKTTGTDPHARQQPDLQGVMRWLALPPGLPPADEIPLLRLHLLAWRDAQGTTVQRTRALDGLYKRSTAAVSSLLPALSGDLPLPVPRATRRVVRNVLDLLQMLADDTLAALEEDAFARQSSTLALGRSLHVLAQQLLISHLIASPAPIGCWQQLHHTYATARRLQVHTLVPRGRSRSLQEIYHAAVLLGCAQPASLTPPEVLFLADYLERFADQLDVLSCTASGAPGTFWIDPTRDRPALPAVRRPLRTTAQLDGFSCTRLCLLLKAQLTQLDAGTPSTALDLPEFAATPAGRGVLGRLAVRWSDLGKRRFLRRRQSHRMILGAGIDGLWQLSRKEKTADVELSTWIITNESPEGYAVMHVSGTTGGLSVGDVAAVRTGQDENWQICLVRWAVSENPEHLELGLQILAPRAVPAILAQRSDTTGTEHLRVLILPNIPNLRSQQSLVVAAGALPKDRTKLLLVIEGDNVAVREVNSTGVDERTGSVEILSIEPDQSPY